MQIKWWSIKDQKKTTYKQSPVSASIFALEKIQEYKINTKSRYPFTIFNPAPARRTLTEHEISLADLICPNETEAEILTGQTIETVEDAKHAALKLRELGFDRFYRRDGWWGKKDANNSWHFFPEQNRSLSRLERKGFFCLWTRKCRPSIMWKGIECPMLPTPRGPYVPFSSFLCLFLLLN